MTPKEKAKELVINMQIEHDTEKRCYYFHMSLESAKRSSLIAVDEVIQEINYFNYGSFESYWQEVKQEIEKL
jgi:hypothetical protein